MEKAKTNKGTPNVDMELVRMYYGHQHERFSELEKAQLTLTNIVLGVSTVSFTFGFSNNQTINLMNGIGLPIIVISINVFAILYYRQTSGYRRMHGKRAKRILELYAENLVKIEQEIQGKRSSGGWKFYGAIHIFMILVALIPMVLYLQSST
jgi:acid phosphatase family membrane protein YuiD